MKLSLSIGLAVLAVLAFYLYLNLDSATNNTQINVEIAKKDIKSSLPLAGVLSADLSEQPLETLPEPDNDKIPFEGDWCVARQDLSETDFEFYLAQTKDWRMSNNDAMFSNDSFDNDLLLSELLAPYKELPIDQLIALGNDNQPLPLVALLQRSDARTEQQIAASRHLLTLGHTGGALSLLVAIEIAEADNQYQKTKIIDDTVKQHLIEAFALVEYGLYRHNSSSLRFLLKHAIRMRNTQGSLDPFNVLSAEDLNAVKSRSKALVGELNEARTNMNLPSIESIDTPKVAEHILKNNVARLYRQHEQDIVASPLYYLWGESYLKKRRVHGKACFLSQNVSIQIQTALACIPKLN
jgi:hypothetical protein